MALVKVIDLLGHASGVPVQVAEDPTHLAESSDKLGDIILITDLVGTLQVRGRHDLVLVLASALGEDVGFVGINRVMLISLGSDHSKAPVDALRAGAAVGMVIGHLPGVRAGG